MSSILSRRRRILIVDDNQTIHEDFFKLLKPSPTTSEKLSELGSELFGDGDDTEHNIELNFDVQSVYQGEDALVLVREAITEGNPFSMAFVDMRMPPGWDGLRTIKEIWKVDPDLQIVLCTAYSDYSWPELVHEVGVTDQLLIIRKPFDKVEICQAALALSEKASLKKGATLTMQELENMVQEQTTLLRREIAERKSTEQQLLLVRDQLFHQATHDTTTCLPNRRAVMDALKETLAAYQEQPVSLVFFDIDFFKRINDEHGHLVGDEVLQIIGDRTKASLRPSDSVGRYGGEEFLVVLPKCPSGEANKVAERIRTFVADSPCQTSAGPLDITVSVGVATREAADRFSMREIIALADTALYAAKNAGRNQVKSAEREPSG